MQGEERGTLLKQWKLLDAIEVPGTLYDTGLGYPAANFAEKTGTVFGELYDYYGDCVNHELEKMDKVEGVDENLYSRIKLNHRGYEFYAYEISSKLNRTRDKLDIIKTGNWRQTGSVSHKSVSAFALNFESIQSARYDTFPESNLSEFVDLKGNIPILLVSPHATSHLRKGKIKIYEKFTGAINVILNSISGVHSLYTVYASPFDSNYYETTALKKRIREIVESCGIKFVMDIHGTGSYRKFDIYPGIGKEGEFVNRNEFLMSVLENVLKKYDIRLGGTHIFPAYRQHTVSRFVNSELGIPAMQIEINKKYREPDTDSHLFEKLIYSLNEFINIVRKYLNSTKGEFN